MLKKWLLALARSSLAGFFLGWVFAHMSFIVPGKRLHETDTLIAIHHPQPAYPIHVLLVPKRQRRNLAALQLEDTDFLTDLFQTVKLLVKILDLDRQGYRLVVNGGAYQDVPHLHFHLISGEFPPGD